MFFVSEGFQESDIREDKPSLYHFELVSRSSLYFIFYSFKFNSWSVEIARNFSLSLGSTYCCQVCSLSSRSYCAVPYNQMLFTDNLNVKIVTSCVSRRISVSSSHIKAHCFVICCWLHRHERHMCRYWHLDLALGILLYTMHIGYFWSGNHILWRFFWGYFNLEAVFRLRRLVCRWVDTWLHAAYSLIMCLGKHAWYSFYSYTTGCSP
jgi:hypothetical protein